MTIDLKNDALTNLVGGAIVELYRAGYSDPHGNSPTDRDIATAIDNAAHKLAEIDGMAEQHSLIVKHDKVRTSAYNFIRAGLKDYAARKAQQ